MGIPRREALHSGGQKCSLCHWPSLLVTFSLPYCWVHQTSGVSPLPQLHLKYHLLPQVIQLFLPLTTLQLADPSQPSHSSAVCSQLPSVISQVLPPHRDFKHFAAFKSNAKLALLQQLHSQSLSVPRTKGSDRYLLKPAKYIHVHSVLSSSGPPWEVGICIFF